MPPNPDFSSDRALRMQPEAACDDRALLQLAAKAADCGVHWEIDYGCFSVDHPHYGRIRWNPLTNDGDALRLAVRLRMRVEPWGAGASSVVFIDNVAAVAEPHYGDDPERATRRAIVRAAAAMARSSQTASGSHRSAGSDEQNQGGAQGKGET